MRPGIEAALRTMRLPQALAARIVTEDFARHLLEDEAWGDGEPAGLARHPVVYWWPWSAAWPDD